MSCSALVSVFWSREFNGLLNRPPEVVAIFAFQRCRMVAKYQGANSVVAPAMIKPIDNGEKSLRIATRTFAPAADWSLS
jgi:hypothetical protein